MAVEIRPPEPPRGWSKRGGLFSVFAPSGEQAVLADIRKTTALLDKKERALAEHEKALNALDAKLSKREAQLKAIADKLIKQEEDLQNRNGVLIEREKRIRKAEADKAAILRERDALERETQKLQLRILEQREEQEGLVKDVEEKKRDAAKKAQERLQELDALVSTKRAELKAAQADFVRQRQAAKQHDAKLETELKLQETVRQELEKAEQMLEEKEKLLEQKEADLTKKAELKRTKEQEVVAAELERVENELETKEKLLEQKEADLKKKADLKRTKEQLAVEEELQRVEAELEKKETELEQQEAQLKRNNKELTIKEQELEKREKDIIQREVTLVQHGDEMKGLRDSLDKERADLQELVDGRKAELADIETNWKERIGGLRAIIKDIKSERDKAQSIITKDMVAITDKEKRIASGVKVLNKDTSLLKREENAIVRRVQDLEAAEREFDHTRRIFDHKITEFAEREKRVREREDLIARGVRDVEEAKRKLDEAYDRIKRARELKQNIAVLEKQENELQTTIVRLSKKLFAYGQKLPAKPIVAMPMKAPIESPQVRPAGPLTPLPKKVEPAHPQELIMQARDALQHGLYKDVHALLAKAEGLVSRMKAGDEKRDLSYDIWDIKTSLRLVTLA